MKPPIIKPQGTRGPISVGPAGPEWRVIEFPKAKAEREQLIAHLFVGGFEGFVATQSEPSLAPFGEPQQNEENDLDFTVATSQGTMLMELAEFAPLEAHGPKFSDAPIALAPREKAALALDLIQAKSDRQGGSDRFLVLYATEQGFWLDAFTIEHLRRALTQDRPRFDRIYYVSPHDLQAASVSEIYPGKPHHRFGKHSDEELSRVRVFLPHPTEWIAEPAADGDSFSASVKLDLSAMRPSSRNPRKR